MFMGMPTRNDDDALVDGSGAVNTDNLRRQAEFRVHQNSIELTDDRVLAPRVRELSLRNEVLKTLGSTSFGYLNSR